MGIFGKGEGAGNDRSIEDLRLLLSGASLPEPVLSHANRELELLARISPSAAEYSIGLTYLNYLGSLKWDVRTEDVLDLQRAKMMMDRRYFGLEAVKERVLEHLAVMILRKRHRPRVLVVDNDEAALNNLTHIISKEGVTVEGAMSGAEASAKFDERPYDVVVTDLRMEGLDGIDLLQRINATSPRTKVILVTGFGSIDSAVQSMKKGAFHYITKPFKIDEVRAIVRSAIAAQEGLVSPGPVLCFAGPPGTGKTSIGMAVAEAVGRRFARISLGGIKDEAEIRGHRRTYAGAQPGRLIEEIRRLQCVNPVIMLDEMDKISGDFRGDPASALLEALDPEQNGAFLDHYLDVPFDLSSVMFIVTANVPELMPAALRDRLEIVEFSGYTESEKVRIALEHLVPKHVELQSLGDIGLSFQEQAVLKIISEHTREAGIRELERMIASICRKIALGEASGLHREEKVVVTPPNVEKHLGPRRYYYETAAAEPGVGVAVGLVRTDVGGDIIFVEAASMKGSKELILTGSLGEVMRESAQTALSYVRSNARALGIGEGFFEGSDIHIHVPAGSIPKDGPSAGATMAVALISLLSGRAVRADAAISGEMTLSGTMLPVGGLKEKLLAARRAGIKTVVLPKDNAVDIEGLPRDLKEELQIITARHIGDALPSMLLSQAQ